MTRRSAMVLMMTLVLITVMMGIVALVLTQSERLSQQGSKTFTQSASLNLINDLQQQLPSLLSVISGPEQLDLALRLPLQIQTKQGDFSLKAHLASPYGRLNINRLLNSDETINTSYVGLFMRIFTLYPIGDADIFLKLVLDTIDTDSSQRAMDTEIQWAQSDFKNGLIANENQFNQILEHYVRLTNDTSILAIPWDRYVGYDGEKMDFNALNAETLSLVLPDVPLQAINVMTTLRTKAYTSKEEVVATQSALSTVFDTYFFIYTPTVSYTVLCDAYINEKNHENHLTFQYNLLDKKVQHVEIL